jgi:hypothetical protein
MDFICSLTGKSPSTTGFGSEGALTKRPFNALPPVVDVNNALVSMIVTGHAGFTTAAGFVGPAIQVDHDVSMLVPEIWCRMKSHERDPRYLIEAGYLEPLEDFVHAGRAIPASRLGYRITAAFVQRFLGRIFDSPAQVFSEPMLKPELQDFGQYVTGILAIAEAQRRVAMEYFEDGSIAAACPPLKALLHIMAHGHWEGKDVHSAEVRQLFDRKLVMASEWYRRRLQTKQARDKSLWQRHIQSLETIQHSSNHLLMSARIDVATLLTISKDRFAAVSRPEYVDDLRGTIGADPFDGL